MAICGFHLTHWTVATLLLIPIAGLIYVFRLKPAPPSKPATAVPRQPPFPAVSLGSDTKTNGTQQKNIVPRCCLDTLIRELDFWASMVLLLLVALFALALVM